MVGITHMLLPEKYAHCIMTKNFVSEEQVEEEVEGACNVETMQ